MEDNLDSCDIGYWIDNKWNINKYILETKDLFLLIHDSAEFAELTDFIKRLPENSNIIYLSMTKTYDSVKPYYNDLKRNIFFIDCVSKAIFAREDTVDCIFLNSMSNFYEVIDVVHKQILPRKPDYIIIDALSMFIDLSKVSAEDNDMHDFSVSLKDSISSQRIKVILLYDNKTARPLRSLPRQYISKIVKMDVVSDKISWQG